MSSSIIEVYLRENNSYRILSIFCHLFAAVIKLRATGNRGWRYRVHSGVAGDANDNRNFFIHSRLRSRFLPFTIFNLNKYI